MKSEPGMLLLQSHRKGVRRRAFAIGGILQTDWAGTKSRREKKTSRVTELVAEAGGEKGR